MPKVFYLPPWQLTFSDIKLININMLNAKSGVAIQVQLSEHSSPKSHHWITFQFHFLAVAILSATLLALAGDTLLADFASLMQRSRARVCFNPQQVRNQSQAPNMPALVHAFG